MIALIFGCITIVLGSLTFAAWYFLAYYPFFRLPEKQTDTRLSHEKYPELLEWEEGDNLTTNGMLVNYNMYFHTFDEKYIYLYDNLKRRMYRYTTSYAMQNIKTNNDLQTRKIKDALEKASEYQKLITEFKSSIAELNKKHGL